MAHVLRQLTPQTHPALLVGANTMDDAGVYRISDDVALVLTTDFFPPLVDDPYDFGRIAAANALSDVYAMGGEPLAALNLVGYPDKELSYDWLTEILRGGADTVAAAGAVIAGGHSVRDAEIKYGLAVTGRVHPERVFTNAGAQVGDKLVLTKPIGSGVLASAAKKGALPAAEFRVAIDAMAALNKPGRDAAADVGVHACTDVTGFGLVGHAFELADASDKCVRISASAVPLLPRTLEFARDGVLTRAHKSGRDYLGARLAVADAVEPALAGVLLDAQTSGGLLLSVARERTDALLDACNAHGTLCATVVGEVLAADDDGVRVRVER